MNLSPPLRKIESEIDMSRIPPEYRDVYRRVLLDSAKAFSLDPNDIGRCSAIRQSIHLKDVNKVACTPPYRTPFHLQPVVAEYVTKLLNTGVLQRSNSPFSSPLMLVRKANADSTKPLVEQYRVVHDYRRLNDNTIKDSYPLHNLYDLIDKVSQAKLWSVIDLSSGFWNQELDKASQKYTAFGLPGMGHFEYTRSAQGLCNSPPAFQRLLDFITKDLPNVYVYVDDVVICSNTHLDHCKTLKKLFERFIEFGLKCRLSKVQLGATEINYLGYNISHSNGIRPGLAKTIAVKNWKPPGTVKEVKQFLGLCSFFRRTIKNFAQIASALTKLTRKDSPWLSGPLPQAALESFCRLQKKLCERPCLTPVDFHKEFILTVDASSNGLGAILSQIDYKGVEHPCAYASTTLSESDKKKAPFHLEYQAMVWGCRHFKPYLAGRHFTIRTDHKPLLSLNKTQGANLDRLKMELQEFEPFTIQYIKGNSMPADGLSRQTESLSLSLNVNSSQLQDLQKQDVQAKALAIYLRYGSLPNRSPLRHFVLEQASHWIIKSGLLGTMRNDVFLPYAPRSIRETLLRLCHDDKLAGHCGSQKMEQRLRQDWAWPNLHDDVKIYCRSCHDCNSTNYPPHSRPSPLEQMDPITYFNQKVHLDLLGPLPLSHGYRYLLVMVDSFSKWIELCPIQTKEMEEVSEAFFSTWICRHGVCTNINSDQGKEFLNRLFQKLSDRLSINHNFSSVAHPQSNGLAERQIRTTLAFLRKYLDGSNDWPLLLPYIASAHNTSVHSSTQYTPYMAVYARPARLPSSFGSPHTYAADNLEQKLSLATRIQLDIIKRQQVQYASQKVQFDKRAKEKNVQIGDVVYVMRARKGTQFQKFQKLFEGPYRVMQRGMHNNVLVVPVNPQLKRSFWLHLNNLKLAPFSYQYHIPVQTKPQSPSRPSHEPPQGRQRQFQPIPPPVLLPTTLEDEPLPVSVGIPMSNVNISSGVTDTHMPIAQGGLSLPVTEPAHEERGNNHDDAPESHNTKPNEGVGAAEAAPLPQKKSTPVKRLLRSVAQKAGLTLPSSTLGTYPAERRPYGSGKLRNLGPQSQRDPGMQQAPSRTLTRAIDNPNSGAPEMTGAFPKPGRGRGRPKAQ